MFTKHDPRPCSFTTGTQNPSLIALRAQLPHTQWSEQFLRTLFLRYVGLFHTLASLYITINVSAQILGIFSPVIREST